MTAQTARKTPFGVKIRKILSNWQLYVMALPTILLLFVFNYMPMFGTVLAFKKYKIRLGIWGSEWMNPLFRNFELLLNLLFIFAGTAFALLLALLFNEIRSARYKKITQSLSFLPYFISTVVVGIFVSSLLGYENGTINGMLEPAGLPKLNFYANAAYWPWILLVVNIWKGAGYNSVVYLATIAGIDSSYYEAAKIDGATRWDEMRYISLPLLMPTVIVMTLLSIGKIMNSDFGLFYNVTGDNPNLYSTTDVLDTYIYRTLRKTGDIGISTATGLFQSCVSCCLVLLSNWAARRIDEGSALF